MIVTREQLIADWEVAERLKPGQDLFLPNGGEKQWIPAEVPGHVHLDLMKAGIIADPFYRMQERSCQWIDEADWTYRTTFQVSEERLARRGEYGKHFLDFGGLDTICRVYLNDILIGTAENFYIPHRFDVTDHLQSGDNTLRVEFDSALRVGRERAQAYLGDGTSERGAMNYFNFAPRAFVRKAQYMYGWDWGPELISCGIWKSVELVTVPVAEIRSWRHEYRRIDEFAWESQFLVDLSRLDRNQELTVEITLDSRAPNPLPELEWQPEHDAEQPNEIPNVYPVIPPHVMVIADVRVGNVMSWSSESPVLYDVAIKLKANGEVIDSTSQAIGFKTTELLQEPDADGKGAGFLFRINGVDTFIKGANWIPCDSFPSRETLPADAKSNGKARLLTLLTQAKEAGFNMLRVWGGGFYESEEFYDLCDQLGILVWQDFPFACSSYPDDLPEFKNQVHREACKAIVRLSKHPSLALWCGGNENLELHQGRWAGPTQATQFFGDRIIHEILPEVLAEHDSLTPYVPNSPYGDAGEGNVTNENYGDSHYWNVWHSKKPDSTGDWTHYAESVSRFSAEFGFAAPAGMTAWKSCMAPQDFTVDSPVFKWHDKTRKGHETYLGFIEMHYPKPATFEDLVYYGQCNQADALKFGIEHYRRLKGRCWGTLFWQLNDCWPTHSWSVIDSALEPKAAYYACKRFYAPLLLSLVRNGNAVEAHLVNDTLNEIPGKLTIRLLAFTGEVLAAQSIETVAPSNAASGAVAALSVETRIDAFVHATFVSDCGEFACKNSLLLAEPKEIALPNADLAWKFEKADQLHDSATLTVSARNYAGYVWITFEGLEAQPQLSDNFFHLAPGQEKIVHVSSAKEFEILRSSLHFRHL